MKRLLIICAAAVSVPLMSSADGASQCLDADLTQQKEVAAHAASVFAWPLTNVSFAAAVDRAEAARTKLEELVPQLESKGVGAKSRASLAVLDDFFAWMCQDLSKGWTNRAVREAREMALIGETAVKRAQQILAGGIRDAGGA